MATSNAAFVVRAIRPEDRAGWAPLWDGYNAFYGRSGPTALDPAITEATWRRFAEPVHALVAESAGEIVGLAHYLFHRSTTQIGPNCYLQDLFTRPEARGRGIAAALIAAAGAEARAGGAAELYWQTHETNAVARALYDRVAEWSGFIVYEKQV